MEWRDVVEYPSLKDLPYKIETNEWGQIVMTPKLYLEAGAKEFWLCDNYGDMRFFSPREEMEKSGLFPEFPVHIDIAVVGETES